MTVRLVPENRTRAPFALDCSPAPSSITPALTSSSLYFAIAASISSDGILPASESFDAFTITMKRIGYLSFKVRFGTGPQAAFSAGHPWLYRHDGRGSTGSTRAPIFFEGFREEANAMISRGKSSRASAQPRRYL